MCTQIIEMQTIVVLDILILLDDTTEYGKLFQIATACEKKEK